MPRQWQVSLVITETIDATEDQAIAIISDRLRHCLPDGKVRVSMIFPTETANGVRVRKARQ